MTHPAPTTGPATDIPAQMNPSPANMPGAQKAATPPGTGQTPPAEAKPAEDKPADPNPVETDPGNGDTVEMDRFKAVQKIARDLEKQNKSLKDKSADAEAYQRLMQALGAGNGEGDAAAADPMKAIEDLRSELTSERTERLREKIATTTGVPASQIFGDTEEAMKASAETANSWAQDKVNQLLKQAGVPLAAPAGNVTSTDVPGAKDTRQIQSRDELKTMTHEQITAAYKDGRMDKLLGKT